MSSHGTLRAAAITEFARVGYVGTSLQRIADEAGVAKSSVLYHYATKEALLDAALGPAINRIAEIFARLRRTGLSADSVTRFIGEFVDFLLANRLEVHILINQGRSVAGVPVFDRGNALIAELADYFCGDEFSLEDRMRFGVALGGAAYSLATAQTLGREAESDDEARAALVTIVSELLAPIPLDRTAR